MIHTLIVYSKDIIKNNQCAARYHQKQNVPLLRYPVKEAANRYIPKERIIIREEKVINIKYSVGIISEQGYHKIQ